MSGTIYKLHRQHRKRHKERFLDTDGVGFSDHEIIELLLFYSIPRRNTNDIAHNLCERFGTVDKILEASVDELEQVEGVGHNSAVLIKNVFTITKKYISEKAKEPKQIDTIEKAVDYGRNRIFGSIKEVVYATFTDNALNVIDTCLVSVGALDEAKPLVRNIIELCIIKRANAVVLFHNHPRGGTEASNADVNFTSLLERELDMLGLHLVEHIVLDSNAHSTILKNIRVVQGIREHIDIDRFYEKETEDNRKEETK